MECPRQGMNGARRHTKVRERVLTDGAQLKVVFSSFWVFSFVFGINRSESVHEPPEDVMKTDGLCDVVAQPVERLQCKHLE